MTGDTVDGTAIPGADDKGWKPPPDSSFESGEYEPPPRIRNWMILIFLGVVLLVAAIPVTRRSTFPGVTYKRVQISTEGLEKDPVTVSGLLMSPANQTKGKHPGVVFAHGILVSKEWYIQVTRPMVLEGFTVLSLDLRGHGGSSGYCTFGKDEVCEMWAAARYLREEVPEVDPECIIAAGHSLGGVTATRAAALQKDSEFSGVAAIWCWVGWKEAVEDIMGPMDEFLGRAWMFTPFSRHIDVYSAEMDNDYCVLDIVDDDTPPNYLLAIGKADEMASVDREEQLIEKMTDDWRAAHGQEGVDSAVTYGRVEDGTARRLVVTGDDHITELVGGVIDYEMIKWIKLNAGIPEKETDRAPFLWGRTIGLVSLALSIMLLSLGFMSLVRLKMFPDAGDRVSVRPPWGEFGSQGPLEVILYIGAVVAASFLAMPLARAAGMGTVIPYVGLNEASVFNIARSLVILPVFAALLVIAGMRYGGIRSIGDRGREMGPVYLKSAGYALIPLAIILIIMLSLGGVLLLPRAIPRYPFLFLLAAVCIGGGFWIEDYMFYKLAYPALERDASGPQQWFAVVVHGLVLDLVVVAALAPLVNGFAVKVTFQGLKIPLLILIAAGVFMFVMIARLSYGLRKLTGSSMAYAVLVGSISAWFMMGPIGVRGF